jgi:GNAT superfamily N-acetyltransferase
MNDRSLSIQTASSRDIPELVRLFNAYREFYEQPPDEPRVLAFICERIAHAEKPPGEVPVAQYFLAWTGSAGARKAVGFMHLIPSANTLAMRPIWFLEDLYVEASMREQGVATALLRHAEAFARNTGAERLTLATAHDNAPAQAAYGKAGYVREEYFWYFHRLLD